jgi:hypothetical protein
MNKKFIIFNIVFVMTFVIFIFIVNLNYYKGNIRNTYQYDSLKNGDIIPFESMIVGDSYIYGIFSGIDKDIYFTSYGQTQIHLRACYCKDDTCIEDKRCDLAVPINETGHTSGFKFKLFNYKDIFNSSNKYTGWKVYLQPVNYMEVYKDYIESLIGTYYDIYLIPTNDITNTLITNKIYYDKLDYEVLTNNWKDNNSVLESIDSEGIYSIKFSAKKGDIITFDIKTTAPNLEILLNDKNINDDVKLNNDIKTNENLGIYKTKVYEIKDDGDYILTFKDNKLEDDNNTKYYYYYKYTYLRNINILRPNNNGDMYIAKTDYEYIVGDKNE